MKQYEMKQYDQLTKKDIKSASYLYSAAFDSAQSEFFCELTTLDAIVNYLERYSENALGVVRKRGSYVILAKKYLKTLPERTATSNLDPSK